MLRKNRIIIKYCNTYRIMTSLHLNLKDIILILVKNHDKSIAFQNQFRPLFVSLGDKTIENQ